MKCVYIFPLLCFFSPFILPVFGLLCVLCYGTVSVSFFFYKCGAWQTLGTLNLFFLLIAKDKKEFKQLPSYAVCSVVVCCTTTTET